ncbi:hypothetical protein Tco_0442730 [Tanacetum coccineum]
MDEPQRNGRSVLPKLLMQNLLTTRTIDDEGCTGLNALLTFTLQMKMRAEGVLGDIVLENLHDKTNELPEVTNSENNFKDPSKSDGYGSKPESIAVSSCVCQEFEATSKDPEGYSVDDLIIEFPFLFYLISLMGASSKSCEYVLDTLIQVFEDKWFAHAVKERTLDNLITEILIWLLDEKRLSNTTTHHLDGRRTPPPSNESFATRNMKFSNLVVKCLIKLTKDLQSTIDKVDLDHILQIIHVYLQELSGHTDTNQEEFLQLTMSKLIDWRAKKRRAYAQNSSIEGGLCYSGIIQEDEDS